MVCIFDLDGTLANCEHRLHLIDPEKYKNLCEYSNYRIIDGKAVIDLDGKPSWRYKKTGEPLKHGWQAFFEACDKDEPIKTVINVFHNFHAQEHKVQIWSGRCESVREKTYQWLLHHVDLKYITRFCPERDLKMRPIGDYTPDDQLKEKWLDEELAKGNKIEMVFDDRPKVVRMWRRRGIFVFNCCQHDGEF